MMKNNILLFSLLMFMQVFVLNKILFFDYVLLAPYVLVLILYPYYKDSIITLVIGFLLGLIIDVFNDSLGLYSFISIIILYFKNSWVLKIIGEDKAEEISLMSIFNLGSFKFFNFSFPIVMLYYILLLIFESNAFFTLNAFFILLFSSISTYVFMILIQYLFLKLDLKNDWK